MEKTNLLTIKIVGKEFKDKEGKSFVAFKAISKDGKFLNCSFRKEVENAPKKVGMYEIKVRKNMINIDDNRLFPKVWIKEIAEISKLEESSKIDKKAVDMFTNDDTNDDTNDEELPF